MTGGIVKAGEIVTLPRVRGVGVVTGGAVGNAYCFFTPKMYLGVLGGLDVLPVAMVSLVPGKAGNVTSWECSH